MKTNTKFALAALTAILFATGSALADESGWVVIDNHHGSLTYLRRPTTEMQPQTPKQTTVALAGHRKGFGRKIDAWVKPVEQGTTLRAFTTPHGTVEYFAPAE